MLLSTAILMNNASDKINIVSWDRYKEKPRILNKMKRKNENKTNTKYKYRITIILKAFFFYFVNEFSVQWMKHIFWTVLTEITVVYLFIMIYDEQIHCFLTKFLFTLSRGISVQNNFYPIHGIKIIVWSRVIVREMLYIFSHVCWQHWRENCKTFLLLSLRLRAITRWLFYFMNGIENILN